MLVGAQTLAGGGFGCGGDWDSQSHSVSQRSQQRAAVGIASEVVEGVEVDQKEGKGIAGVVGTQWVDRNELGVAGPYGVACVVAAVGSRFGAGGGAGSGERWVGVGQSWGCAHYQHHNHHHYRRSGSVMAKREWFDYQIVVGGDSH